MRNLLPNGPFLIVALAVAASALAPARASAQIMYTIQEFGDRQAPVELYGTNGRPLSEAECTANVDIPIDIVNAPYDIGTTQVISIWRGAPTSAACQTATNRRNTGTGEPPCTFVTSIPLTAAMQSIELGVQDAFESCGTATELEFWFLVVNSAMDTSTDVPVTNYFTLRAALDPTPPAAPTELMSTPGDAQIQISWTNPEGLEPLEKARIYYDSMGCDAAGEVTSTTLVGGAAAPSGTPAIDVDGQAVRTATVSGEQLGIDYDAYAAVAVALVDRAGNESVLSEPICVQRVQVSGFWDAYCSERGMDVDTCSETYGCGVGRPGARGSAAAFWVAMLAMIGAALRRGRRAR